ncbi:MAG: hypothetical protein RIF36_00740 [Imperialibacter sp.]|uniref:hypothetical protein n=1 Tax=Imperialibacter sp. TaxID=2038411 RepID=UPI0032EC6E47
MSRMRQFFVKLNLKKRISKKLKSVKGSFFYLIYRARRFDWINFALIALALTVSLLMFYFFWVKCFIGFDHKSILSNLLTVNGVFSAILITYLFTRITWAKDRKLETREEAIRISRKITEFRRILKVLTDYYNVWVNQDRHSKSLLDHGKFGKIDFYDFRLYLITDSKKNELFDELYNHDDFSEGVSMTYLAMISIVEDRGKDYRWQQELYKHFDTKGIYNINIVEKWIDINIFNTISYWLTPDRNWIYFGRFRRENQEYIKQAAARFDEKYTDYELDNNLLKEMADDIENHYLKELYKCLLVLKRGITSINLLILSLVSISLVFGVLIPFVLLLINGQVDWFYRAVAVIASVNAGLMTYFVAKFPFLINRELKWL